SVSAPVPFKDTRPLDVKLGQLDCSAGFHPLGAGWGLCQCEGGVGGIAMVIFGYVVSYVRNYEYLKHDGWRKQH
uniref:ATP synthase membrane subunit f n=1 Tax=Gopherus agassizii TaxID=38772 RepID=A0A452GQP1_9SAUR